MKKRLIVVLFGTIMSLLSCAIFYFSFYERENFSDIFYANVEALSSSEVYIIDCLPVEIDVKCCFSVQFTDGTIKYYSVKKAVKIYR